MKSVSLIMICTAVITFGINAIREKKLTGSICSEISRVFFDISNSISVFYCGFSVAVEKEADKFPEFVFLSETVKNYKSGVLLPEAWKKAADSDLLLKRCQPELKKSLKDLAVYFSDSSAGALLNGCARLSEDFLKESEKLKNEYAEYERLVLTGSLLGAAAIFIILI